MFGLRVHDSRTQTLRRGRCDRPDAKPSTGIVEFGEKHVVAAGGLVRQPGAGEWFERWKRGGVRGPRLVGDHDCCKAIDVRLVM